jgi:hypothetical protein
MNSCPWREGIQTVLISDCAVKHADLELKEKAPARTTPIDTKPGRYQPPDQLLAFLEASDYADPPADHQAATSSPFREVGITRRSA